jgi:hypothetical protein
MAGFSQGAIELKKKNSISAAPNDFIKLSINTDNIPYTVDENGVYRYLNYYNCSFWYKSNRRSFISIFNRITKS